ncbi:MAG: ECF transporter S component [Candidatus Hermodarchaeota archaeon]
MEFFKPKMRSNTLFVALLAILTALTTIATIVIAIPLPASSGFLNFGDALVMLSGLLLGPLGGFIAGGVGSAMGDVILGYVHFAPITLVVKGCEGLVMGLFSSRARSASLLTRWDVVGLIVSSFVMMTGYFLAEIPLYGYGAALAELLTANWLQVAVGSIVTAIVGPVARSFLQDTLYMFEEEDLTLVQNEQIETPLE